MPWARLDDRFPVNQKVRPLSDAAFRLHVSALCWSAENLTDGHIDTGRLRYVSDVRQPAKNTRELVTAGLWHEVTGGWQINDWHEYNPSREEVITKRKADAEKKRLQRLRNLGLSPGDGPGDSPRDTPGDSLSDSPSDTPRDSPVPAPAGPPAPGPSRPVPSGSSSLSNPPQLSDAREPQARRLEVAEPVLAARKRAAGPHGQPVIEGWDIDHVTDALTQAVNRFRSSRDDAYDRLLVLASVNDSRSPYRLVEPGGWNWAGDQLTERRRGEARQQRDAARNAATAREHAATSETQAARRRRIVKLAEADPDGWAQAQVEAAAELEAEGAAPLPPLVAARALDICERQAAS